MSGKPRLRNRVAIVTGASSGLGRAIALAYHEEGAKVVCADIRGSPRPEFESEAAQKTTRDLIVEKGGDAIFIQADVCRSEDMKYLLAEAANHYGHVDIMVNNAGVVTEPRPFHELNEAEFDRIMSINCRGTFLGCKYAAEQMLRQEKNENGDRGWIINIASVYSLAAATGIVAYTASKHAVSGITKSAALDYASSGIHVNAICPAWLDTALVHSFLHTGEHLDELTAKHPWGRLARLQDITGPAVFLASDEASFITGSLLFVDGGFTIN